VTARSRLLTLRHATGVFKGGGVRGASARKEQNGLLYATAETDNFITMRICLKVLSDKIDLAESGLNIPYYSVAVSLESIN
jgi:hypothetical protein